MTEAGEGLTEADIVLALADALGDAGVERGYVGGDAFRQTVAQRLLRSDVFRAIVRDRQADTLEALSAEFDSIAATNGVFFKEFVLERIADRARTLRGDR